MSPELETFDQLLGGDLPLAVVRSIFPDGDRFVRAILAMLECKELRLLLSDGTDVPHWQRSTVLAAVSDSARLALTPTGARRIG
jgi:hypothetical protein